MTLKEINSDPAFFKLSKEHCGVFGSEKWLSIYDKSLRTIGIYKDDGQIIGGFWYLDTRRMGLRFIKLPPYTPHCGLFFSSPSKNKSAANSFAKEVVADVCDFISAKKAALTVMAFPVAIKDMQPFIWSKYKVVPNYTYRIDLTQSLETIVSNFDSKNRNAINKAIKDGVEVSRNKLNADELFTFLKNSLTDAGANVYGHELNGIFKKFASPDNSFSMEARHNGELKGVVFCIHDFHTCYYLLAGLKKGDRPGGINNLLVQHSIQYAKELGCTVFDFEGSMLKGVEKFFRSFGPELYPYYTVNKGHLPIELLLKFKKRELF